MARTPPALARRLARLGAALAPRAGRPGRWLPVLGAAAVLGVLGVALLASGPGQVATSREISLLDAQPDEGLAALDGDQDLLSDLEEITAGTDPRRPDTDGDLLPDHWEARHARLDPLSNTFCPDPVRADADRDCDRDGLTNAEEHAAGTDPGVADLDQDGVPDGFEVRCGSDPRVPDAALDPDGDGLANNQELQAGTRCDRADSDLDGLEDPEELRDAGTNPVRLSTSGSGVADGWLKAFGLSLVDAGVGFEDPDGDGLTNLEEYLFMAALARGSDASAPGLQGAQLYALFQRGLDPFSADTDRDGMSDGYEVRFGLDPLDPGAADPRLGPEADPDQDGLTNREEAAAGSNPFLADTDGDGLTDLEEVRVGWVVRVGDKVLNVTSDPTRADGDGDGLTDLEEREGRAVRDGVEHTFPRLDPRSPDTDLDALGDLLEVTLPIVSATEPRRLDPTDPDTDKDRMLDGAEYGYWGQRRDARGPEFEDLLDRVARQMAAAGLQGTREAAASALGPGGDLDGDGKPNLLDLDSDGDGLDDGKELDPDDKAIAEGEKARRQLPVTDPALVDTDGEGLPDAWEHEFAQYLFELGDWNLNASNRDSLKKNDGLTDADRDLDGDGVALNDSRYPRPHTYRHTNLFEFLGHTHPNQADTDRDGLTDGWETYFTCITASTPRRICGELTRDPRAEVTVDLDPAQADADRDGTPDGNETSQATPYARFVRVADSSAADALLVAARGERFQRSENTGPDDAVNDLYPGVVVRIKGEHRLTHAQAFARGLDPSARDTDGDGMPDPWEVAWGLNPLDPSDARRDADGDGLTNLEEYERGTEPEANPHCGRPAAPDTDCGGLDDGKDANPAYPPDDAPEGDTDCDGVANRDEGPQGTSLAELDSDRDGLLDGPSIAFFGANEVVGPDGRPILVPASRIVEREGCTLSVAGLLERVRALGVAQNRSGDGLGLVTALGERWFQTLPDKPDTDGDLIPDGWEAFWADFHGLGAGSDASNPGFFDDGDVLNNTAEYRTGMPPGWEGRGCGVWWLGSDPRSRDSDGDGLDDGTVLGGQVLGTDLDLDNDGLDDFTGEDPAPLYDHHNHLGDVLATCASYTAFAEEWVFRRGRLATATLDTNRDGVPDRQDFARVRLTGLNATLDPDGALPEDERGTTILKGARFLVRGKVVVNETTPDQGKGVAGALVLVNLGRGLGDRSGDTADVLGVAVTGSDGTFEVEAAVNRTRGANLSADVVLFGRRVAAGMPQAWNPDTSANPPDAGYRIVVWVASRQEGPEGPYGFQAAKADGSPFPARGIRGSAVASGPGHDLNLPLLVLKSGARLTLPASLNITAGQTLRASGQALDSLGDPLPRAFLDGLRVTWLGQEHRSKPQVAPREGGFDLELGVPASTSLGPQPLSVRYDGVSGLVAGASASATVDVRYPTNITGRVTTKGLLAVVGEPLVVEGEVRDFRGQPLPAGLEVRAELLGTAFPGNTTAGGRFRVEGPVPPSANVGTQRVSVVFPGSSAYEPSRAEAGLVTVVQKTTLSLDGGRSPLGRNLVITGTLADLAGNAVDDPTSDAATVVNVSTPALSGQANVTGTRFTFTVPGDLLPGAGPYPVRAEYGGTGFYRHSTDQRDVQLSSRTRLTLEPATVARGEPAGLQGRLLDEKGRGVEGERVLVTFPNHTGEALTDPGGRYRFPLLLPRDHALGGLAAEARFVGGRNGLLEAAEPAGAVVQVVAATRLEMAGHEGPVGPVPVKGSLRDDRGQAVPGAKLQVLLANHTLGFAVTDLQGRFDTQLPVPQGTAPGTHEARVRFGGTTALGANEAAAPYRLLKPSNVTLLRADALVRDQGGVVLAQLRDADGQPLGARTLEVRIGGTPVGASATDAEGVARILAKPPAFLAPGNVSLEVRFQGDDGHTGDLAAADLPLRARTVLEAQLPAQVDRGQVFGGVFTVRDDAGRPLAGAGLVVLFSGYTYPVRLTTDAAGQANFTGRIAEPGTAQLTVRYQGEEHRAPAEQRLVVQSRVPILAGPGAVGLALLALAAVVLASAAAARVLRQRGVAEAQAIVREAEERLFASTEYQASILWAYRRLVDHVRARGVPVEESYTARELTHALAEALPVGRHHLERLVAVFEEARYSPHPIGPRHRDEALAALRGIEADLRGAARPQALAPGVRRG